MATGGGFGERGDEVYEALLDAHGGLSEAESLAFQARLILLLAEAAGDPGTVLAAIAAARRDDAGSDAVQAPAGP